MAADSVIGQRNGGNDYAYLPGTSMAPPQVTGAVTLVRAIAPVASVHQVVKSLEHGADGAKGMGSPELGAGCPNDAEALDAQGVGGGNGKQHESKRTK